ncbi:MAG: hypothetical protein ACRC2V_17115, partial [Xenococcaceae cyanobacterium]
ESATRLALGDEYFKVNLPNLKARVSAVKSGNSRSLDSNYLQSLDDEIDRIVKLKDNLAASKNVGALTQIAQGKAILKTIGEKLDNLPRRVADLSENKQLEYKDTQLVKVGSQKAASELDKSLAEYRTAIIAGNKEIEKILQDTDSILANIDNGEWLEDLVESRAKTKQQVASSLSILDDSLKKLEVLQDLNSTATISYYTLPPAIDIGSVSPLAVAGGKEYLGLDIAIEARRKWIDAAKKAYETSSKTLAVVAERGSFSLVLDYKETVIVEQQKKIQKVINSLQKQQREQIAKIRGSLSDLNQADPVVHFDLKPYKLFGEFAENAAYLERNGLLSFNRLKAARTWLTEEVAKELDYPVRFAKGIELVDGVEVEALIPTQTLTRVGIKAELEAAEARFTELTRSRRGDLADIGATLKYSIDTRKIAGKDPAIGASTVSLIDISKRLAAGKTLTTAQQRGYDLLDDTQKQLLQEASESGIIDLYDDLFRLSVTNNRLAVDRVVEDSSFFAKIGLKPKAVDKSLKTRKWEEVTAQLDKIQKNGFPDVKIEILDGTVYLRNFPAIDSTGKVVGELGIKQIARGYRTGITSIGSEIRKLQQLLGVDRFGNPIEINVLKTRTMAGLDEIADLTNTKKYNYQEILFAEQLNRQNRTEIGNRLELYNFNQINRHWAYFVAQIVQ